MVYISVVFKVIFPVLAPDATLILIYTWWFFNFNLYNLSFNDFAFLFNSYTDWSSKCLC